MASPASEPPVPVRLVRVGEVEAEVLEFLAWTLSDDGVFAVSPGEPLWPIDFAYDPARDQWNGLLLLDALRACASPGGKVLGVAGVDLFLPIMTHVYGAAETGGTGAIISSFRLHPEYAGEPPNADRLLSRCRKEALHELGHTRGLVHCRDSACVMSFSSAVEAVDLKRDEYCGECERRVQRGNQGQSPILTKD